MESYKMVPNLWETSKLVINDLTEEEIQTVQKLYDQGSYIHQWDGGNIDKDYVNRCFTVGDLPPNGIKDQFKIQVISLKHTGTVVGLLTMYHGYPLPASFYINYLYIDKEYHKQGLGQEVVNGLLDILKLTTYNEVRANVALKNWAALRFWSKLGLDTIQGIFGDVEHGVDTYADVELIKYL